MKSILIASLMLLVLASSVEASDRIYVIRKGDTLSGIAKQYLGRASAYKELARLNKIEKPNRIFAGATLLIPNAIRKVQVTAKKLRPHVATKVVNVRLGNLSAGSLPSVFPVKEISIVEASSILEGVPSLLTARSLPTTSSTSFLLHTSSFSRISTFSSVDPPTITCYNRLIDEVAEKVGISPYLIHAVMRVESSCNPTAESPKGALGLMQLMPDTLKLYGIKNPYNAAANIEAGARHLKYLISRYGDIPLALAAYNAGAGAVNKYGGVPPFPETRDYVARVNRWLHGFSLRE